jgi:EAL domain-containing protein (putative c-di-GMP-specific phosphodiesterase class I)
LLKAVAIAEASRAAAECRTAWLVIGDHARAKAIESALTAAGWRVDAVLHSLSAASAHASSGASAPQVIVTGLRLPDGDAMQLIRLLARRGLRSALFFASHQQRAVIRAAVAMAAACGLEVAGIAEQPVEASAIARSLTDFRPRPGPVRQREPAPLEREELFELIDRGALHPWMQPKLRLSTLEVVGFEALIRANDADGQLVMPDRLVSALGRHGLLDQATLQMACETVLFVSTCLDEGLAASASINVSMQSLSSLAFCQELERTVAHVRLDPSRITIEITESDAMSDLSTVLENTARMRMLGFNLSIDDFGTACSSLTQLSQIPFTELKIDRSFLTDIDGDPTRQAIVRSCAQLGSSLGANVVAEGVETRGELEWARRLGCTVAQGYLVSRPMPAEQALAWLRGLPNGRVEVSLVDCSSPHPDPLPQAGEGVCPVVTAP